MFPGDLEIGLDKAHGSDPPQTDNDPGPDECHLVAEIVNAGVLLRVQGIPVVGRAALDDVGDVHVFLTAQIDELQHLIQQLAAPSHKGLALEVLIFSGSLSDEHDLRIPDAYAEYHMVPGVRQRAPLAGEALSFQFCPIQHNRSPRFSLYCVSSLPQPGRRRNGKAISPMVGITKHKI